VRGERPVNQDFFFIPSMSVTFLILAGRTQKHDQETDRFQGKSNLLIHNEQGQNREIRQSSKQNRQGAGEEWKSVNRPTGSKQANQELGILEILVKYTRLSGGEQSGESW